MRGRQSLPVDPPTLYLAEYLPLAALRIHYKQIRRHNKCILSSHTSFTNSEDGADGAVTGFAIVLVSFNPVKL